MKGVLYHNRKQVQREGMAHAGKDFLPVALRGIWQNLDCVTRRFKDAELVRESCISQAEKAAFDAIRRDNALAASLNLRASVRKLSNRGKEPEGFVQVYEGYVGVYNGRGAFLFGKSAGAWRLTEDDARADAARMLADAAETGIL